MGLHPACGYSQSPGIVLCPVGRVLVMRVMGPMWGPTETLFKYDIAIELFCTTIGPFSHLGQNPRCSSCMQALAAKMAVLEGTEDAVVTSSGMAAISSTLMTLLRPGDHLMIQACGLLLSHSGSHRPFTQRTSTSPLIYAST